MAESQARPLVTFALFAYNQEQYIGEAVKAALAQDYSPLEIIISDDCSSDETFNLIRELTKTYDGPHTVRINRNTVNLGSRGLGAHVNRVLELAEGELIVFAAGDDVSSSKRTSMLVELWESAGRPSGSLHSAVQVIDASGAKLRWLHGRTTFEGLSVAQMVKLGGKGVLGASHAVTKNIFEQFGPLHPSTMFEDRVLAWRSFLAGRIIYTKCPLVKYRVHGNSMTNPRIYSDPVSWTRWMDGTDSVLDAFELDYLLHSGGRASGNVLRALQRERWANKRARGIHDDNSFLRTWAGWHYARDLSIRSRVSFTLECAGLIDRPFVSVIRRAIERSNGWRDIGKFKRSKNWLARMLCGFWWSVKNSVKKRRLMLIYQGQDAVYVNRQADAVFVSPEVHASSYDDISNRVQQEWLYECDLGEGQVVLDVGGGIGDEALVFSRAVGASGRVIAIEAHPNTFSFLRKAVALNTLVNVTALNVAVSDQNGDVAMESGESYLSGKVVAAGAGDVTVRAMTIPVILDELAVRYVDLMKMNIEGAELAALRGCIGSFHRIRKIVVSCHDFIADAAPHQDEMRTHDEVVKLLSANGFKVSSSRNDPRPWVRFYVYASRDV